MIRPLRRRHFRVAIALALLVPAILAAALVARRETPLQPIPAGLIDTTRAPSPP